MKNCAYGLLQSKINIKITGTNIERFIKRLKNNNIDILSLKYVKKGIIIKIYKKDYENLLKLKTIYDIDIIDYDGLLKVKNKILNNKFIIISILFSLIVLNIITNLVFSIDIITNDTDMKNKLKNELKNNGINLYKFKKSYIEINKIKKNILSKYINEIEWIEIENIGTKYIIRYEPRIINEKKDNNTLRNIIAKKSAVIKDMYISSGEVVKSKNTYVKKGDVIVSGYISLNDNIKDTISSEGKVYGECWYNVTVTYPYRYYEEIVTGNSKKIFVIKFLNKEIELFNFKKYKTKKTIDKILIKNNILPIELIYQKQRETEVIKENNNEKEVVGKAIEYSKKKLKNKLENDEYISDYKILNKESFSDSIKLNIFFSIIENITDYEEINEYKELEENIE